MVTLLVFFGMLSLSVVLLRSDSPMKVFLGCLLSCGGCSYIVWLEGQDLYGAAMFLAVGGSLLAAFGFILCLVPWQLHASMKCPKPWLLSGVFTIGSLLGLSWGYLPRGIMWNETVRCYNFSGFMTSEVVLVVALLLFGVMTMLMKLAPLKGGSLRRNKAVPKYRKCSG